MATPDFFPTVKTQLTDARAYPGLELYIIVVACPPQRFMRVQYLFDEALLQWQGTQPEVLVLQSGRAAALLQRCQGAPLDAAARAALLEGRTWGRFLNAAGQSRREAELLNRWPGLEPDQRFVPPEGWDEVPQSLRDTPLTILTGPPATGKTFGAAQLLFQHFREGRPVRWIGANASLPEAGLPSQEATSGWRDHLRLLSRTLGVTPPREPVDAWEFVAANLVPDALVLIEDPFGQTQEDFSRSLHTFDFFNLQTFVQALAEGSKRSSARLLLTSRQGLFEQWQRKCRESGQDLPPCRIITLTTESYRFSSQAWKTHPKARLAVQLIENQIQNGRCAPPEAGVLENVAAVIGARCESPREIELVIDDLKSPISLETANDCLNAARGGVLERTRSHCRTQNDAERLFLLGLPIRIGS